MLIINISNQFNILVYNIQYFMIHLIKFSFQVINQPKTINN